MNECIDKCIIYLFCNTALISLSAPRNVWSCRIKGHGISRALNKLLRIKLCFLFTQKPNQESWYYFYGLVSGYCESAITINPFARLLKYLPISTRANRQQTNHSLKSWNATNRLSKFMRLTKWYMHFPRNQINVHEVCLNLLTCFLV